MSCFGFAVTTLPVSGRGDGGALRACGRSVRRARTEHARIAANPDKPSRWCADEAGPWWPRHTPLS